MNICIYGASSEKIDPVYLEEINRLAHCLGKKGYGLVFGGGDQGMMGAAARGFYEENAEIIGIAPSFFNKKGILYEHCTKLILTDTMRERKQKMEELSGAFLAAPGGIGTYDEFFEILTLRQLEQHHKPVILYNINGFYDKLLLFLKEIEQKNFMRSTAEKLFYVCDTPEEILNILSQI